MTTPAGEPGAHGATIAAFDADRYRQDFPILADSVHGHPLIYLDNAATSQKPQQVLDAVDAYYHHTNANVHRGVHQLSVDATAAYEGARDKVQRFLGAKRREEIIFTRGTTEAINLVAQSYGRSNLGPGDEVLISTMEHHSNIVPWQMVCEQTGAKVRVIPIDDDGALCMDEYARLLGPRTRVVAVTHVSNALGTVNPIAEITRLAHAHDAVVVVDGAQAAPHLSIDVRALDCDFYAISGHKMFAPTGIGALYGRHDLLDAMPPWQGGGEMILTVSFERTVYNELPHKFEAGTPDIAGAVGLGATIDYLNAIGLDAIASYEHGLLEYGTRRLLEIPDLELIGTAPEKAAVFSFVLGSIHPHDIGTMLDQEGIAVRTGHHCAQPVMDRFGIPATTRASLAFYNTTDEIDALAAALGRVREIFA